MRNWNVSEEWGRVHPSLGVYDGRTTGSQEANCDIMS